MALLDGKVALVTGASRGIGAATAQVLAAEGARVILTHRDSEEAAREVCASLAGAGHRVIRASATDTPALERAAASVAESERRLDVLVNNAAFTKVIPHADMEALDDELFDTIMRTNVRGVFATIRAFRRLLAADGGGVIVNVSSLAARMGGGSNVAYCASKAAVDNMAVSLGRALAPEIRVVSVAPGLVDTEFTAAWDPAVRERYIARSVLGRLPTPEDVAHAILAVVAHMPMTTGAVIPVDGGRPLG
ncbi:MAG TPA: SDR family oxidoreductase [Longimicrobiales bacterium]|nr:SDR family oxidoreductase [Longimicrobiales bacterium]